jgi:hypothetical protein
LGRPSAKGAPESGAPEPKIIRIVVDKVTPASAGGPPSHFFVVSRRSIIGAFVMVMNLRTECYPSRRPVDVTVPQAVGPGVYRRVHPRADARSRRH